MTDTIFTAGDRIRCIDADLSSQPVAAREFLADKLVEGREYTVSEALDWRRTAKGGWSLQLEGVLLPGLASFSSARFVHVGDAA